MGSTYRVVKLLKNHLYPTYQLHAFMANQFSLFSIRHISCRSL